MIYLFFGIEIVLFYENIYQLRNLATKHSPGRMRNIDKGIEYIGITK